MSLQRREIHQHCINMAEKMTIRRATTVFLLAKLLCAFPEKAIVGLVVGGNLAASRFPPDFRLQEVASTATLANECT